MLMNIVRARYVQVPNFLTVSSVIASYTYQGGVGIQAQGALGDFDEEFVQGSANLGYIERPTITYSPLQGEAFSRRMMRNIPVDVLFALGQAGWPPDVLFRVAVDRVGNAQNMAFAAAEVALNAQEQVANLTIYDRVINLVTEMQWAGDLELVERATDGIEILRFSSGMSQEDSQKAREFKELVGLDPDRQEFRITDSTTQLGPDDILVQSRSLLAMINFLSLGVEIPEADALAERVVVTPAFVQEAFEERGPIRILSSVERPSDPYAAVRFRDHWSIGTVLLQQCLKARKRTEKPQNSETTGSTFQQKITRRNARSTRCSFCSNCWHLETGAPLPCSAYPPGSCSWSQDGDGGLTAETPFDNR